MNQQQLQIYKGQDNNLDIHSPSAVTTRRRCRKESSSTMRQKLIDYVKWMVFEEDEDHFAVRIEKNSIF